jgi:hypothetical protein
MRVVNEAIYLTNFTPPTSPLTPITNTSLLTCQSNRFIDNSTNNYTFAINGTPRVQAFQPFSPAAAYTPAAYAGSGYFESSQSLVPAASAALQLGTSDFTIEFYAYIISAANGNFIFRADQGTSTSGIMIYSDGSNFVAYGTTDPGSWNIFNDATITSIASIRNTWAHFAIVRLATSIKIYVNGIQTNTATTSGSIYQTSDNIVFGNSATGTNYFSNLRVVKGTAVYTGAFTPPTLAPLTTAGSTSAASYSSTTNVNTSFASSATSLLTNFTNAGIYDAAAQNVITTVGDAQASTTITAQWPPTSMKFDGTGDWLTAIDNPQLQLGTGDFTIDGWVYLSANGIVYGLVSKGTATTGWSVNVTVLNKLQFSYTTSNLTGTTSLATGTWYYFAVVRSGSATGNLKLYLNASLEATSGGAVTDNFNQTSILYVGADRIGTSALNGYLQDVRITKAARAITLPTASFPVQ